MGLLGAIVCLLHYAEVKAANVCNKETRGIIVKYEGSDSYKSQNLRLSFLVSKKLGTSQINSYRIKNNSCKNLESIVEELNRNENIEYVEFDNPIKVASLDYFSEKSGSWGQNYDDLWAFKKIQSEEAHALSEGDGITIAVIDTGIDFQHPDLEANIWHDAQQVYGRSFVEGESDITDRNGHGTHVAGIIAAVKDNNIGIVGVAPQAELLALKAFDSSGRGYLSDILEALDYAIDKDVDIINASWIIDSSSPGLQEMITRAYTAGIPIIASAGNNDQELSTQAPAIYSESITVAATDQNDKKTFFSNYGNRVDIAAPGGGTPEEANNDGVYNILSTMNRNSKVGKNLRSLEIDDGSNNNSSYFRYAGTSMATPFVTGVVALLKSLDDKLGIEDIRTIIKTSADTSIGTKIGAGRINAYKAIMAIDSQKQLSQALLEALDRDKDDSVSSYEFVLGLLAYLNESKTQVAAFENTTLVFDINQDSVTNSQDLLSIQSLLKNNSSFNSANKAVSKLDSDQDSIITNSEISKLEQDFLNAKLKFLQNKKSGKTITKKLKPYDFNNDQRINYQDAQIIENIKQAISSLLS